MIKPEQIACFGFILLTKDKLDFTDWSEDNTMRGSKEIAFFRQSRMVALQGYKGSDMPSLIFLW